VRVHRVDHDITAQRVTQLVGDAATVGVIADESNRDNAATVATALQRRATVRRLTVTRGINGRGAKDLGVLPNMSAGYRAASPTGKHGREILEAAAAGAVNALLIVGPTDAYEAEPALLERALRKAESVVALATVPGVVSRLATVLVPGHAIVEKSGTVTNVEGRVQRIRAALPAASQTPPETRVLGALAAELGGSGIEAGDAATVGRALRAALPAYAAAGNGGRAQWAAEVAA